MKRPVATAVTFAVAAIAIAVGAWTARRSDPAPGAPATAAATEAFYRETLADAAGAPHPLAAYRGRVVVVNFWATWCVPCVKEIPTFSKVHADGGGKIAFVGLGIDSPDNIRAFDARFKPSYPLLAAGASGTDLARAFGDDAGALPFTVVLDASGQVIASHLGQVDEAMLRAWLAASAGRADRPVAGPSDLASSAR